jgi:hypothetical protein
MAEEYQRRFGAPGDVLYPSRAAGIDGFDEPPPGLAETNRPLTYGYAGSLGSSSYVRSVAALSAIAKSRGDRLLIFSNLSPDGARAGGLAEPHVEMHPYIPFRQLIDVFRSRVDVLFVPMSFDPEDRLNAEIAFPSKLADYTTIGLPLLIQGPAYCSAIRWAGENAGVAAIVDNDSPELLRAATTELADPARRIELASNAIRIGRKYFSHEVAFQKFTSVVCRNSE